MPARKKQTNLNQEISFQIILCLFVCTFRTVENLCNISVEGTHITVPKLPRLKENTFSMWVFLSVVGSTESNIVRIFQFIAKSFMISLAAN